VHEGGGMNVSFFAALFWPNCCTCSLQHIEEVDLVVVVF